MKNFPPPPWLPRVPVPPRPRVPIPAFHPVPTRNRHKGWTALRQAEFIGHLAESRSVSHAAAQVGMARESAYRLRTRRWAEGFCAAWDAALGTPCPAGQVPPRKVTLEELSWRVEAGLWQVRMLQGRYAGVIKKADNSALLSMLARLGAGITARPAKGAAR